jgi:hypothetical protein
MPGEMVVRSAMRHHAICLVCYKLKVVVYHSQINIPNEFSCLGPESISSNMPATCVAMCLQVGLVMVCMDYLVKELHNKLRLPTDVNRNAL